MFRLTHPDTELGFFFEEVRGPWTRHTKATCMQIVDINQDGLDDVVMCNKNKLAFILFQHPDSTFSRLKIGGRRAKDWRNARVSDVNGDSINDFVVVGWGGTSNDRNDTSYVRVFEGKGTPAEPIYNFRKPDFELITQHATPDVEVLDANGDGVADVYVVLVDERPDNAYCGGGFQDREWWATGSQPPVEFTPPADMAQDLLLIGDDSTGGFTVVNMTHAAPGCGFFVEKFGNDRCVLLVFFVCSIDVCTCRCSPS